MKLTRNMRASVRIYYNVYRAVAQICATALHAFWGVTEVSEVSGTEELKGS